MTTETAVQKILEAFAKKESELKNRNLDDCLEILKLLVEDQIPEDDLYDWDSRIKSGLEFTFRKGYQHDSVLADQKRRRDAIYAWDSSLGGYDF